MFLCSFKYSRVTSLVFFFSVYNVRTRELVSEEVGRGMDIVDQIRFSADEVFFFF